MIISVRPEEVSITTGVPPLVKVCPGITVLVLSTTKPPPDGFGLTITGEDPAVIVALGGFGVSGPCCSGTGVECQLSSQPVAGTSTTGEQPLHGAVIEKFGSEIS